MKCFAYSVVIILFHCIWEKRTTRHFTQSQIFNLWENFIYCQYEWNSEMFVVHHILICIPACPSYLSDNRTQFKGWFVFAQQYDSGTSDASISCQSAFAKKCLNIPSIYLWFGNTTMYLLNILRALAIATSSRSSIVASGTICADQSVSPNIGSSRMTFMRSVVNSTRESSIRCHALLWA